MSPGSSSVPDLNLDLEVVGRPRDGDGDRVEVGRAVLGRGLEGELGGNSIGYFGPKTASISA